jgi:anion transporter
LSAIILSSAFGDLPVRAAVTLAVFLAAVFMWIATPVEDSYVALAAALVLVLTGGLTRKAFTEALGSDLVWLVIGAFVIAAAVNATGLMTKFAEWVVTLARTPRQLVHLMTAALLMTTFAVPSTSARAALALPVFMGLAAALSERGALVLCMALLFPTVILLSAIGSLLGAGAHLVTNEILGEAVNKSVGFVDWILLGLPLALVWSHLAAEVILMLFTRSEDRRSRLSVPASAWASQRATTASGPLSNAQRRVLILLAAVIIGWCTEPIHHINPAIVALTGALVAVAPRVGTTSWSDALKTVPWSLLIFMAATLALATAVTESGAADWLARAVLSPIHLLGSWATTGFVVVVILGSIGAHVVVQSRSARSAVLIPLVVTAAPTVGINPVAAAFISTAAAGFCLTLTSSAKPLAMFAAIEEAPTFSSGDLLRLSAVLAPTSTVLLAVFTFLLWPALGLGLYRQ